MTKALLVESFRELARRDAAVLQIAERPGAFSWGVVDRRHFVETCVAAGLSLLEVAAGRDGTAVREIEHAAARWDLDRVERLVMLLSQRLAADRQPD